MTGARPTWDVREWSHRDALAWPSTRRGLVVRVRFDGVEGWGEASPMPGYNGDSLDSASRALHEVMLDPSAWNVVAGSRNPVVLFAQARALALDSPSAACAMETAILDAWARSAGLSVAQWLLAHAGRRGSPDRPRRVMINTVVAPGERPEDVVRAMDAAWARGVRSVKLKVGRDDGRSEIEAALALREEFGRELELRLDANGHWRLDEACERLAGFAAAAPAFCEQPVRALELDQLPPAPVPIAADESCADPEVMEHLLSSDGGSPRADLAAIVLKPMALGGVGICMDLAERASNQGVPIVVTHLLDGPFGSAIAAEFAAAAPADVLACGLAQHAHVAAWGLEVPQVDLATAGSGMRPGLGIRPYKLPAADVRRRS